MKNILFFLFLQITLQTITANQNLTKNEVTNLNVNLGLASNEVNCIIQDNLGFMWFGTTNGLCRYDGYQFKTYRSDYLSPSFFISNHILLMEKDLDGNIWIVTSKEVVIFNPVTGQTTPVAIETHLLNEIKSLLLTKKGEVFLGTTVGVYKYERSNSQLILIKKTYVRSLYEDSRGYIWVGTWENGFFTLNAQTLAVYDYDLVCKDKGLRVTGFVEDNKHRMWISTWDNNGIIRLDNPFDCHSKESKVYLPKGKLPSSVIYKLVYNAHNNELWVATAKGLIVLTDLDLANPNFKVYDSEILGGNEIWTLYYDNKGLMWVSVLGGGVNKIVKRKISFIHSSLLKEKPGNRAVTSFYEDTSGKIWIGMREGVLLWWDKQTGQQYSYKDIDVLKDINPASNAVQAILKHRDTGDMWLGTRYDGVYIARSVKGELRSLVRLRDSYPAVRNVNTLAQDLTGRVWVATNEGLYIISPLIGEKEIIQPVNKLNKLINSESVQAILCDKANVWIGTKNYGIFHLSADGSWRGYNLENSKLNYDNILCFYKDSNDDIWVGTQGGGLCKYNAETDRFEMLKTIHMFSDNVIYSITEDKQKNLWLATGKGLVCMSLMQKEYAKLYTQSEGLGNTQFIRSSALRLSSSEILFGGYNGVDCYLPNRNSVNSVAPKTVIVDVSVMNVPLQELIDKGELDGELLSPSMTQLQLAYNQNNVMLSFSCLSYTNPQANRYAYRLKGVDKDWIYVDANKRYISYNNMNRGNYVFQVKSCNENSIWSDAVEMKLTILPPPWLTWWAYLIYTMLFGLTSYLTFRLVRKRIRLQNALKIEQIEHKKSEEVNQAKLIFFTNISHELFTPLSVMQCSIDSLKQEEQADKQTLGIMQLNLKRLQRLLQQILEFRKAESGNLKLMVSYNNLVIFVKKICEENFYPLLQSKNITLNFQSESDVIMAYFDIDKLDKIIYNLLSNALKYNYQDGIVSVSVSKNILGEKEYVVLKVENTGDGIPESRIPLLFKRFYEGDYRKFKTKGTGIGLSLTKDLVELHQGTITVQSVINEITVFTVMIPARKENYAVDQIDEEIENKKNQASEFVEMQFSGETPIVDATLGEQAHLLLVEDDVNLLMMMAKVLRRLFKVSIASNGQEALELLKKNDDIEIVITDYVMPEMNGIELCREVRKDATLNYLPIVMLTAKTQTEFYLEGYDAGADLYIAKPVEMALLTTQIKTLITNRKLSVQKYRCKEDLEVKELGLSIIDQAFLERAISIVEQQLENNEFSNEIFCQMMNMTQSTLYRRLKLLSGMTPNEFIRDIRIKKACMLLLRPDLQVADVAYMVGFTDPKYFSLIFKKEKGMPPTKYLESVNFRKIE